MKTFLGKPHPQNTSQTKTLRYASLPPWAFLAIAALCLIAAGIATASTQRLSLEETSTASTPLATVTTPRVFAQAVPPATTPNPAPAPSPTSTSTPSTNPTTKPTAAPLGADPDPCAQGNTPDFSGDRIFPLITNTILGRDAAGKESDTACSPPYWNLRIAVIFMYKILGLLNWTAITLATFATIYAGLLYIGGFLPNSKSAEQAKKMLVGTYVGLIIVLSARLILGSTQLITGRVTSERLNTVIDANIK